MTSLPAFPLPSASTSTSLRVASPRTAYLPTYLPARAPARRQKMWQPGDRFRMYFGGKLGTKVGGSWYKGKIESVDVPAQPMVQDHDPWDSIHVVWDKNDGSGQTKVRPGRRRVGGGGRGGTAAWGCLHGCMCGGGRRGRACAALPWGGERARTGTRRRACRLGVRAGGGGACAAPAPRTVTPCCATPTTSATPRTLQPRPPRLRVGLVSAAPPPPPANTTTIIALLVHHARGPPAWRNHKDLDPGMGPHPLADVLALVLAPDLAAAPSPSRLRQVSPWEIEVDPETEKKVKEDKRRAEEAAARAQRLAAKEKKQRVALGLEEASSDEGEGGRGAWSGAWACLFLGDGGGGEGVCEGRWRGRGRAREWRPGGGVTKGRGAKACDGDMEVCAWRRWWGRGPQKVVVWGRGGYPCCRERRFAWGLGPCKVVRCQVLCPAPVETKTYGK